MEERKLRAQWRAEGFEGFVLKVLHTEAKCYDYKRVQCEMLRHASKLQLESYSYVLMNTEVDTAKHVAKRPLKLSSQSHEIFVSEKKTKRNDEISHALQCMF